MVLPASVMPKRLRPWSVLDRLPLPCDGNCLNWQKNGSVRAATCVVTYDADQVTGHARRVALADVVREIGRQSGAEVVGHVRKPRDVSQEFDGVPLVEALARLLEEQNFTLRYGPEGKLRTITLLGEPLAVAAAHPTQADASSGDKPASGRPHPHHGGHASRETRLDGEVRVSVAGTET